MADDKKEFKPVEPKIAQPLTGKAAAKEALDLLHKAGDILKEYDNKESNIPLNHEYWDLMNRYRSL